MPSEIIAVPTEGRVPASASLAHSAPDTEGGVSGPKLGHGNRILIVEDEFLIASQIELALTDAGFDVVGTASTGKQALQLAQARLPTLAVMDIHLAGDRDGIDTAIELFQAHGIRCVFASAYSDQEARSRAAPASPLGWLQKPYTMSSLTAMVRAAVEEAGG